MQKIPPSWGCHTSGIFALLITFAKVFNNFLTFWLKEKPNLIVMYILVLYNFIQTFAVYFMISVNQEIGQYQSE